MKHDLIFTKSGKVERTKFFSTSYEVWCDFFLYYDINPDSPDSEIQLDYFEDPAMVIDYSDKSFTAFAINDLGTILLIKFIARRYAEYGFNFFIQDGGLRWRVKDASQLFDTLLDPLTEGIMKKHLTLFT